MRPREPEQLDLLSAADEIKLVYVAGPFRHANQWGQFTNIRRAEEVALMCWKRGWVAICPHLNTMHFQGALPDRVWLEGDLEIVRRCDAVVLCPGWEKSAGAQCEVEYAQLYGIPVYDNVEDLPWRNTWAMRQPQNPSPETTFVSPS